MKSAGPTQHWQQVGTAQGTAKGPINSASSEWSQCVQPWVRGLWNHGTWKSIKSHFMCALQNSVKSLQIKNESKAALYLANRYAHHPQQVYCKVIVLCNGTCVPYFYDLHAFLKNTCCSFYFYCFHHITLLSKCSLEGGNRCWRKHTRIQLPWARNQIWFKKNQTLWKPNFYYITAKTHTNLTLCQALLKMLCINSIHSQNPVKIILLLCRFYRWANQYPEDLSNSPKFIQLAGRGRGQVGTLAVWPQSLNSCT